MNATKTASIVVFCMVALVGSAVSQEMKQEMKKEMKKDMKQEMIKEGNMANKMFECTCGFTVASHDAQEAMDMGKMHVKNKHQKDMSDEDAKKMMKSGDMMKKKMKREMDHH